MKSSPWQCRPAFIPDLAFDFAGIPTLGERIGPMRDPKITPHPGDRFRCKNGTELEATGAVFSATKTGGHTPCLYVSRTVAGRVVSRGVSTIGVFRSTIRSAEIVARGSDSDPWANAERRPHSDF
jgi:hypothetical protein